MKEKKNGWIKFVAVSLCKRKTVKKGRKDKKRKKRKRKRWEEGRTIRDRNTAARTNSHETLGPGKTRFEPNSWKLFNSRSRLVAVGRVETASTATLNRQHKCSTLATNMPHHESHTPGKQR